VYNAVQGFRGVEELYTARVVTANQGALRMIRFPQNVEGVNQWRARAYFQRGQISFEVNLGDEKCRCQLVLNHRLPTYILVGFNSLETTFGTPTKESPRDVFGHSDSAEYKRPSLNVRKFPFLEFSPNLKKRAYPTASRLSSSTSKRYAQPTAARQTVRREHCKLLATCALHLSAIDSLSSAVTTSRCRGGNLGRMHAPVLNHAAYALYDELDRASAICRCSLRNIFSASR
jgi:hypothetical protein